MLVVCGSCGGDENDEGAVFVRQRGRSCAVSSLEQTGHPNVIFAIVADISSAAWSACALAHSLVPAAAVLLAATKQPIPEQERKSAACVAKQGRVVKGVQKHIEAAARPRSSFREHF